jgi:hypothetical protein
LRETKRDELSLLTLATRMQLMADELGHGEQRVLDADAEEAGNMPA